MEWVLVPPGYAVRPPPASGVLPHRFAIGEMMSQPSYLP
jgi:hypothetical protein